MQRSLFAAIAIVVAGLRAPTHIATLSQTIAAFQKDSFKEFVRQDALPRDIALRIGKVLPFPLAEAGQPFNSGCTVERGRISRRFVLVGVSRTRILFAYQHGGLAPHLHALGLTRSGSTEPLFNITLGGPVMLLLETSSAHVASVLAQIAPRWHSHTCRF